MVGILNSPIKFWNFEEQIRQVSEAYFEFFKEEVVIGLIELMVKDYLGRLDWDQWVHNSKDFIETEDELHLIKESNMELDHNFNELALTLIDKLI